VNWELRKIVAHLYATGYTPKAIVDRVAELTGRRYSLSYIRKIIWLLKREGLLARPPASSLWTEAADYLRAAKLHAAAAKELLLHRPVSVERALREIDMVIELIGRAQRDLDALYIAFSGARVAR